MLTVVISWLWDFRYFYASSAFSKVSTMNINELRNLKSNKEKKKITRRCVQAFYAVGVRRELSPRFFYLQHSCQDLPPGLTWALIRNLHYTHCMSRWEPGVETLQGHMWNWCDWEGQLLLLWKSPSHSLGQMWFKIDIGNGMKITVKI